ncbi:hypothetical protein E2C01_092067 [Portunus trituberculatus]|uniref:Uncharacterized protein n=1 Tax=Portunus trituberculatus TaxID=210409 RepID=A0A5B7JPM5_PORTR|nr:hypothetical protein [Portunus trituberculatus]
MQHRQVKNVVLDTLLHFFKEEGRDVLQPFLGAACTPVLDAWPRPSWCTVTQNRGQPSCLEEGGLTVSAVSGMCADNSSSLLKTVLIFGTTAFLKIDIIIFFCIPVI